MIESHFESKLNHTVQRASPFQCLCEFQNDGIFRVPSRALFIPIKVVETLMIAAFHLFIFLQFRIELEIIELFFIKMVIYYMDLEMLSESCNQLLHMLLCR